MDCVRGADVVLFYQRHDGGVISKKEKCYMTFGEKLSKLRRENNYTQEQLADKLDVSRQSVSKWESDIAYPETDKLIEIGRLFDCSMDYLLKDDVTEKNGAAPTPSAMENIAQKITSKDSRRKMKRALIVVCVLLAVVLIAVAITFVAIIQRFNTMKDALENHYQPQCLDVYCQNKAIEGGMYCEDHTCIEDGCTNKKEIGDFCPNHALTYAIVLPKSHP